jgi:tRNA U34 2-thiouridine synthase MnmA/TrmU
MQKKEIKLIEFINIRYADPISAIDLKDNYLLFGSMLGSITFYIIDQKKLFHISDTEDEYISGVKIKENILYV